jgi:hypothetical protein
VFFRNYECVVAPSSFFILILISRGSFFFSTCFLKAEGYGVTITDLEEVRQEPTTFYIISKKKENLLSATVHVFVFFLLCV